MHALVCEGLNAMFAKYRRPEGEVVTPEDVAAVLGPGEVIPYTDTQTQRSYLDGEATAVWENADGDLFMVDRFFVCPGDF